MSIGSHVDYTYKHDGMVKARTFSWAHRDNFRDNLRCNSSCMNLKVFRLVLFTKTENYCNIGKMDIIAAFLRACGFGREVYAKPPKEAKDFTGLCIFLAV